MRSPWRKRARVFLGDAGSSFLGLALAWFLIDISQGREAAIQPVSALWFAMLVTYSAVEIIVRRVLSKRSPLQPDREHLHHVFLLAGFTVSETVWTMGAIALIGVVIAILGTILAVPHSILFGSFVLIGLLFLGFILRTWKAMQFLHRSICRRRTERREHQNSEWKGPDRRKGADRRQERIRTGS